MQLNYWQFAVVSVFFTLLLYQKKMMMVSGVLYWALDRLRDDWMAVVDGLRANYNKRRWETFIFYFSFSWLYFVQMVKDAFGQVFSVKIVYI